MEHYLNANTTIWINTKAKLRKDWLAGIDDNSEDELKTTLEVWWRPEVRMKMQMFKAMLDAKKQMKG